MLAKYSHDASIFEIEPEVIVFPKNKHDISRLIHFVSEHKKDYPDLSITPRAAGTDMSGGAINDSIILSFEKTFKKISHLTDSSVRVEPGVYYRNLEKFANHHKLYMPAYPASKNLCMVGGIVANNSGGEKSLRYGKVIDYVLALKVILRDGNEYLIEPLDKHGLDKKLRLTNLEGEMYRKVFALVDNNYTNVRQAKPNVSKNSTGYNIWDVWNKETFDLTKLFVGSQGTLGVITQAELKLIPRKPLSGMVVIYLPNLAKLGDVITTVLSTKPSSFESFDDHTLNYSLKSFPYFLKTLGLRKFLSYGFSIMKDLHFLITKTPKLILLVEYEGDNQEEIDLKIREMQEKIKPFDVPFKICRTAQQSQKYWTLRRESFNILRHNVQGAHTAPFIDDFVVPPEHVPEFFPKLKSILDESELIYTIAGHLGDGNFHIIPLMKLQEEVDRDKIEPVMKRVNKLVMDYQGSISGEHNDGLIRGPFLHHMYPDTILNHFKEVKEIFDPQNIFNPHKKMDANWNYSNKHIRKEFR